MIRFISLLVSIPLIALIAAFTYKNAQLVSVDLFIFQIDLPMAVLLLIAMFVGILIGFIFNIMAVISQKKKYKRLENKKETLQGLSGVLNKSKNDFK